MSITPETMRLVAGMRIQIGATVDDATNDLIRAWATGWAEVTAEWETAVADLVAASDDGRWPSPTQVTRAERARRALDVTRGKLIELGQLTGVRILQDVQQITTDAADWHARLIASQVPATAAADTATLVAGFNRVDPFALDAIVRRTTGQVTSTALPLSVEAMTAVQAELIRGVAVGDNPRRAAARMVQRVEGAFNGGLNRALVIARTEMLDAHRAGGQAQDVANKDVLAGWTWTATLDRRTCPSCWAKHGSTYEADDPGPLDHQQGRCARVPKTLSWRELGFDLDEPPSVMPDAQRVFAALPEADQLQIMGPARLDALNSGRVAWADLARRRETPDWRPSYAPVPVRDLPAAA